MARCGMIRTFLGQGLSLFATLKLALFAFFALPVNLLAATLPALDAEDTIVVTADQAWESDSTEVLNFKGNFQLTAPHYQVSSVTAELHGDIDDPITIIASGTPARFWVEDDETNERTYGSAERLEYDIANGLIRLSGNAEIRDAQTVMRSNEMEYDTESRRLVSAGTGGVEIITQ